ncbi:transmembrane protein 191C isoform X2 [Tursiops truncatus]|uniref:transmembrane protein 191C isoform X2 n=1 Tax=Tursiops truncatus TaxID=9739 RepID=UPI003CCF41D7
MGRGLRWGRGPRRGPDRPLDPVQEQQNHQLQEQWEELSSQVPSGDGFRLTLPLGSPTLVPVPISAASPPPRIIPTPRSPASPALTSPTPQLFYYGEQLSPQRAERQLGTQLVALQELQGKVMEAATALDASQGDPEPCESQPGRGQGCAGSLMEEVAKADCVSAGLGGDGLVPGPAPGATHTHVTTPSGIFPPSPRDPPLDTNLAGRPRLPRDGPPKDHARIGDPPRSATPPTERRAPTGSAPPGVSPHRSPARSCTSLPLPRRSGCSAARARRASGEPAAGAAPESGVRGASGAPPPPVCRCVVVRRLWALGALQTLLLLLLGVVALPLLYLALVNPSALRRGLMRPGSDAAIRRLRYTLAPLLELRARGLLPA